MQFQYFNHQILPIPVDDTVEDIVILRSSIVVFYLQRYSLYNTYNIKPPSDSFYLKNKIVKPRQVDEQLIAAVQPRGRLILINPYKNEVVEIIDLPLLVQKNNSQWFYFNRYYIFPQSGLFTYREEGYGNSIGLATFRNATKVLGFKYNIQVKGSTDTVCSSIDQFDNNCTFVIYEPIVKRSTLNLQLLTITNNSIFQKGIDLGEIYTLHKNINVLAIKMIDDELFMMCIKSDTVRSLYLFVNQVTDEIVYAIQSQNRFIRQLFEIKNDSQCILFESAGTNPPGFMIQALICKPSPVVSLVGPIISGDILVDYAGRRVYKWWTDSEGKGAAVHLWSVFSKKKLYNHLIRARGIDTRFSDTISMLTLRLLR